MSPISTPEAEPKAPKDQKEKKPQEGRQEKPKDEGKEKKEKTGEDGAQTSVSPEIRKKVIDEYLKEQEEKGPAKPDADTEAAEDVDATIWNTAQDTVRGPLQKLFKIGLFAANPVVYAGVWGADKLLQKVPLVNKVYGVPRNIVRGTAASVRDVVTMGVTSPAVIPDIGLNMYEGLTKQVTKIHARGIVGRTVEFFSEKIGKIVKKTTEIVPKLWEGGGKILKFGWSVIEAPFKGVYGLEQGIDGVTKKIPFVGKAGPLTHVLSTAVALGLVHYTASSIVPMFYPPAAVWYQSFLQWLGL